MRVVLRYWRVWRCWQRGRKMRKYLQTLSIINLNRQEFLFLYKHRSMGVAIKSLDIQINGYMAVLNTRQKKALLTVAKTFAEETDDSGYSDEFKRELDSRYEEYMSGGKLISEAEANKRIRKIIKGK